MDGYEFKLNSVYRFDITVAERSPQNIYSIIFYEKIINDSIGEIRHELCINEEELNILMKKLESII
jgi:hypothetical protein